MPGTETETQYKQAFIERVRQARAESRMTQQEVADALQQPQDHYKHWEQLGPKGRLMPHHLIPAFCIVCRVDLHWLLTGRKMKKAESEAAVIAKRSRV